MMGWELFKKPKPVPPRGQHGNGFKKKDVPDSLLIYLYNVGGFTTRRIAQLVPLTQTNVARRLRLAGVPMRAKGPKKRVAPTESLPTQNETEAPIT